MNESIAYNCRKMQHFIHGCFLKDGIIRIKRRKKDRLLIIFHMNKLHGVFPDFDFGDAYDEEDIFLDVLQVANDSVQSSYKIVVCS